MRVFDRIDLSNSEREITPEGYLSVPARLARIGTYQYRASDIDYPNADPDAVVTVFRPANEVFAPTSLDSFAMKPVTDGHPPEQVTVKNIKQFSVGHAGGQVTQDGEYIKAQLLITDEAMIEKVRNGTVEVSNGYDAEFDYTKGTTDTGEHYDAVMKNIRGNHIAIVDKARGGRGCRLSDENTNQGDSMKKIMVDGIEIETTEQGAQVIAKLENKVAVADAATAKAKGDLETAKADHEKAIAAKDAAIADAEAKIVSDADLDKLVAKRADIVGKAKRLVDGFDPEGKTNAAIVEEVALSLNDGLDLEGKSDTYKAAYCTALFDAAILAKDNEDDGSGKIAIDDKKALEDSELDAGDKKRAGFIAETENAWKGE